MSIPPDTDATDTSDASKASDDKSKKTKLFKEFQGNKAFPENLAELFDECANDERRDRAERNLEDL